MTTRRALLQPAWALAWVLLAVTVARGQDLEPRRWTHMPVGMHVFGLGLVQADGDLALDPVLELTDTTIESRLQAASYVYAFGLLGKSARVDVQVPYQQARWSGKLSGSKARVRRSGFADPRIRFSINLVGAPALQGKQYMDYREQHPTNTVIGAGVAIRVPLGEYNDKKLLNIGQNRYSIRPQLGVLHTRGPWSYELTASTFLFTDNDDFFGDTKREQDPLHALQVHVVRTLSNGWWVSAGSAYGWSGRSKINGVDKDDRRGDLLSGASFGFPIASNQAVKFAYIRRRTQKDVGVDSDSVVAAWSVRF